MKNIFFSIVAVAMLGLTACSTVQTTDPGAVGVKRKQFMLLPEKQVESMATQSYLQTLKEADSKQKLNPNPQQTERIRSIAKRLIAQTGTFRKDALNWKWEVNVISSKELNAFCMPGGKIMFYSGLIQQLDLSDDEIAVVMGHEVAHALAHHGGERMSQGMGADIVGELISMGLGKADPSVRASVLQFYGLGAQVGVMLPFSRSHESEADKIGLILMAKAGYDPRAAVGFWERMAKNNSQKQPEFLSTHPSDTRRIEQIKAWLPEALTHYQP